MDANFLDWNFDEFIWLGMHDISNFPTLLLQSWFVCFLQTEYFSYFFMCNILLVQIFNNHAG